MIINWEILCGVFVFGFILDILATIDTQAVLTRRPLKSFVVSTMGGILSLSILIDIVGSIDIILKYLTIVFYSVGGGAGGSYMIHIEKIKRSEKRKQQRKKKEVLNGRKSVA